MNIGCYNEIQLKLAIKMQKKTLRILRDCLQYLLPGLCIWTPLGDFRPQAPSCPLLVFPGSAVVKP